MRKEIGDTDLNLNHNYSSVVLVVVISSVGIGGVVLLVKVLRHNLDLLDLPDSVGHLGPGHPQSKVVDNVVKEFVSVREG